MFKNILIFIVIYFLWIASSIISPFNEIFYNTLNLPFYTPASSVFSIIWTILFGLITISIMRFIKNNSINNDYLFILIVNYLFCELFSVFFFNYNNLLLSLITSLIVFISSLFLFKETKKLDIKSAYYLVPYLIWLGFSFLLMMNVYLIN